MERITNRLLNTQIVQVEKVISIPKIQYIEKEVPIEVEKLVHIPAESIDLNPIHSKLAELEARQRVTAQSKNEFIEKATTELNMQSRALVALKAQRDIDRKRRLMLIQRLQKQHRQTKDLMWKMKLAVGVSLLIAIVSLIVKL